MVLSPALGEDQPLESQPMAQSLLQQVGPLQQHSLRLPPAPGCVELPQVFHQRVAPAGDEGLLLAMVWQGWGPGS